MPLSRKRFARRLFTEIRVAGPSFRIALALVLSSVLAAPPFVLASPDRHTELASEGGEPPKQDCELNSVRGDIQHVIYIHFSHLNVARGNSNGPSDLEQLPHLLHFLENNGTVLTNHHSDSHAQPVANALTAVTGLYPERFAPTFASTSGYWTSPLQEKPASPHQGSAPNTSQTKFAPAPWVPFTRAGCNVGAVAIPKMTLENTAKDILTVFGENSLEAALFADPSTVSQAAAQFQGIAIHCAAGNSVCSLGVPDLLPDEPRTSQGFNALFGHKHVAPILSPNSPLADLDGKTIADAAGTPGFPGVTTLSASQSLAYVAAMQEHSVPVTFAYVSGPHQSASSSAESDPSQVEYLAQLRSIDNAFEKFFARLNGGGINQNNTLFVITADDGPVGTRVADANTTFLALVGPGISLKGIQSEVWSDHADIRPTMLALVGLKDAYLGDGRALIEVFQPWALPAGTHETSDQFLQLATAYKRIAAPVAEFAQVSLRVSTTAEGAAETKHNNLQSQLLVVGALRNDLSTAMANLLNDAVFHGRHISEPETRQLVRSANDLLEYVKLLAANGW